MTKQILTLDSLYQFFVEQNKTLNFSSKDAGKPIVVTTNGYFETDETEMPGMLKLELKVCHTETNRNGSHISTENMEKAMPTLKYRPILAYIHELEDGTKDFYAHNIEVVENEDGESEIVYVEKQVGCFTADEPWLKYDKKKDKTYVHAYAVIPEGYTEAADIIRRKNGTKVSCELVIDELSYNAKEKYLDLTSFYFGGCTLLGCDENGNEIGEGMLGARADIADFCREEPTYTYQDKMIEVLEKLNVTLSNFNTNTTQKGGDEMKFEELLAKYGKTAEEVTFEIEGLSDEELEAKFAEVFGDDDEVEDVDPVEEEPEAVVVSDDEDEDIVEDEGEDVGNGEGAGDEGVEGDGEGDSEPQPEENFVLKYELSHDDIRSALYNLLAATTEDGYYFTWIIEVYDNKFIYQDYQENKFYRQGYTKDGDNVALDDNKVEVFNEWLSKDEKDALDTLKADYSSLETKYNELKEFKDNYDAAELKAQKDAVLERAEYEVLADDEAFKALIADADKYSVEEVEVKAKAIFADHVIKAGEFSAQTETHKPKTLGFNLAGKETKKKKAYGGLFD